MRPLKNDSSESIAPAVHMEFIQNHAAGPDHEGVAEVESYHRALFLHHHARDLERFQQQSRIHEDRLAHLEGRLKDAHARLSTIDKLIPVRVDGEPDIQPTSPWNRWDRAMFVAGICGIAFLLIFGVLNISFNLLESGLVTFMENPVRAYFWAALLPVGALAVKVGWDFLQSPRLRDLYLWCCLVAGIAGVLVWVAAYASVYPTLSKSTAEQIESLSVFDETSQTEGFLAGANTAGVKRADAVIVAAQAVAEIFLSAVLGMYMTAIYARHRPVRLSHNPLFSQLDEERRELEESVGNERLALADARGNVSRLENQLAALVAYARSMFQKEAATRRDETHQKQVLLDQISNQLRTQLAGIGSHKADSEPNAPDRQTLTFGRENGK
jgi:hypothetical protein